MAHTPHSDLQDKLDTAKEKISVGRKYYHWKHPDTHYQVIAIGLTEWNEEVAVVYQNTENGVTWIRPLEGDDGWFTPVERDGDDKRRFVPVEK